jgi:transposase-like protein/ribosomal protein L37AE/L43A
MFKGTDILEFTKAFDNKEKCLKYLSSFKWQKGFTCPKCGNTSWSRTKHFYIRRCNKCKNKDSATAGTLFHRCRIEMPKAFMIVFLVTTGKKGISSTELSRRLSLQQKTCYYFKRKIMAAMQSSGFVKLQGKVDVDEFVVGGYEKGKKGRSKGKRKQVVMGIEMKNKGIVRCYAKQIDNGGSKELKPFFQKFVSREAKIRTDKWRGYEPLKKEYTELKQEASNPSQNFKLFHRQVMMVKGWIRGIHHSVKNLQPYLDEFSYRFNRLSSFDRIFHNITGRMIYHQPVFIKNLKME